MFFKVLITKLAYDWTRHFTGNKHPTFKIPFPILKPIFLSFFVGHNLSEKIRLLSRITDITVEFDLQGTMSFLFNEIGTRNTGR